jgi:hypothetical protein
LPTGISPPGDSNYDGMNAFADGTPPASKTQNRIAGWPIQGYNFLFYDRSKNKKLYSKLKIDIEDLRYPIN